VNITIYDLKDLVIDFNLRKDSGNSVALGVGDENLTEAIFAHQPDDLFDT
jgi:hypothetical protein